MFFAFMCREVNLKLNKKKKGNRLNQQPFCMMCQIEVVLLFVCVKLWNCILLFSFFVQRWYKILAIIRAFAQFRVAPLFFPI